MKNDVHSKQCASKKGARIKRRRNDCDGWLSEIKSTVRGETALWTAVITQAMMDAMSHSRQAEAMYHKHEAIRWLCDNSKDFVEVCLQAGYDPDYVRKKAKRALASPQSWRAAPGESERYLERKAYRQKLKSDPIKKTFERQAECLTLACA